MNVPKGDSNTLILSEGPKEEKDQEDSMLSLSLRPRNNPEQKIVPNFNHNSPARLPLQMTEIEPHFSRDLSRSIKNEERPKTPPQPAPAPLQPPEELKDEDLNDLISAFSLEKHKKTNRFLILSPAKKVSMSPKAVLGPRRTAKRTFQLTNAYNNGLNFSPTTTKFTLLYGHHQPTTFKIVSPAKLGLDPIKTEDKKIEGMLPCSDTSMLSELT